MPILRRVEKICRSELTLPARLGRQDKGNRHHGVAVSGQALVCTLFWCGAGGTFNIDPACRVSAQTLGLAGFRPAL